MLQLAYCTPSMYKSKNTFDLQSSVVCDTEASTLAS